MHLGEILKHIDPETGQMGPVKYNMDRIFTPDAT